MQESSKISRRVQYLEWNNLLYAQAWDRQTALQNDLIALKRANRDLPEDQKNIPIHKLIFCEHSPVYTLGKSGNQDHLLLSESELSERSIEYFKINRGGDITYHGPGQITGYPIFDLDYFFTDIHKYIRTIEEAVILMLKHFDINGTRIQGYTGVWIPGDRPHKNRKICALGVHLSRWITMHGFALNVNTDLDYFNYIVPCGIADEDKVVTSMQAELGHHVDMVSVKALLKHYLKDLFEFEYIE